MSAAKGEEWVESIAGPTRETLSDPAVSFLPTQLFFSTPTAFAEKRSSEGWLKFFSGLDLSWMAPKTAFPLRPFHLPSRWYSSRRFGRCWRGLAPPTQLCGWRRPSRFARPPSWAHVKK